jgi:N-acetylneuraminic acid mutarotase
MDLWTPIKDMKHPRAYSSVCLVKNNNYLYIFGGMQDF